MRSSLPGGLRIAFILVGMVGGLVPLLSAQSRSLITLERLKWDCYSSLGRRELTLFGNGSLRLREGLRDDEQVWLVELGPDELRAYLDRLEEIPLHETPRDFVGVEGEWVEQCRIDLDLPTMGRKHFEYGRYDTLNLGLRRIVEIARELDESIDREAPPLGVTTLDLDYEPQPGDVLRSIDGGLFEVIARTADKRGIELRGVDRPLTLYVLLEEIPREFVSLEKRPR